METLNVHEAADFLKIHPVTLCSKAATGHIPGARVGRRWVFVKDDLLAHIRAQYTVQAMEGVQPMGTSLCHFSKEKIHSTGGSKSRMPTDDAYSKALGLATS